MLKSFDVRRKVIRPGSPKHSRHRQFQTVLAARSLRQTVIRCATASIFFVLGLFLILPQLILSEAGALSARYELQATLETIRASSLARQPRPLPIAAPDPKVESLISYLEDKRSPLVKYARELARMPNWKLLIAIAQAESNLCKKTEKNNCWGIGPNNTPWSFNDISESLYYANYLLSKYDALGMRIDQPENIVRAYVGYDHPGWVNNVKDTLRELKLRGLE